MQRITLAGLLKLELPGHTVRLCDGGTIVFAGETYLARDPVVGVLSAFEALTEGVGDEAPAGTLTFLPPDDTASATLQDPAVQASRIRVWIAEIDDATGLILGAPQQEADWIVDYTAMSVDAGKREWEVAFVSSGDRFFQLDRGNSLSPAFHRGVHPGEAGLDNAAGVEATVAWGAPSPPRGTASAGGAGGVPGGGLPIPRVANV